MNLVKPSLPHLARPPLPYLLLLAVLLFGNCGGVRGAVHGMSRERHDRFRAIFARWQTQRIHCPPAPARARPPGRIAAP